MVQYVFAAVHLKYLIQIFCCHILVIAVQGKTQTRIIRFVQVPKFVDVIEHENDTMLNIFRKVRSPLECLMFCSKQDNCKSVFIYKERQNGCQLRSSVLSESSEFVVEEEVLYYKRVENTEEYRDCLAGWLQFEGSRYCFVASESTWFDAESDCQRTGGYLVEIESLSENNFIGEQVRASREGIDYWIGATDAKTEGKWVWFNSGNKMTYQNWYSAQPNNGNGEEHYAYIGYGWKAVTMWDDTNALSLFSYICEY